ncbi:MAG: hypothetical protein O3B09_03870 [Proteobacteria bacterium]|nr:hypothetical protein [Pseudomonadota bacterium]
MRRFNSSKPSFVKLERDPSLIVNYTIEELKDLKLSFEKMFIIRNEIYFQLRGLEEDINLSPQQSDKKNVLKISQSMVDDLIFIKTHYWLAAKTKKIAKVEDKFEAKRMSLEKDHVLCSLKYISYSDLFNYLREASINNRKTAKNIISSSLVKDLEMAKNDKDYEKLSLYLDLYYQLGCNKLKLPKLHKLVNKTLNDEEYRKEILQEASKNGFSLTISYLLDNYEFDDGSLEKAHLAARKYPQIQTALGKKLSYSSPSATSPQQGQKGRTRSRFC